MDLIGRLRSNNFFQSAAKLAAGTLTNQLLLFVATPFLSRIYHPEQFGHLAIFTSIATILSVLFSLRLENALVLVPEEKNVNYLARVILLLIIGATIISAFLFITYCFFFNENYYWLLVILQGALMSIFNLLMFSFHRRKKYSLASSYIIFQTCVLLACNFLFGFFKLSKGLVISNVVSFVIVNLLMYIKIRGTTNWRECIIDAKLFRRQLADHRSFFSLTTIYTLLNIGLQSGIPLLLGALYTDKVVGYYSLSNRLLRAPFLLFVGSLGNVFKNEITELYLKAKNKVYAFYSSMRTKLILIASAVLCLYLLFSPYLFSYFLGEEWAEAKVFGYIVAFIVAIDIVEVPLNFIYSLLNRISVQLKILVVIMLAIVLFIPIFHYYFRSATVTLLVLSGIYIIGACSSIYLGAKLTNRLNA